MGRPKRDDTTHLKDGEFFSLALPPIGEPEAIPEHLSECLACTRALAEWKTAVRELAAEDVAPVGSRSPAQWAAVEDRTLEAIRQAPALRPRKRLRWALGAAAALLVGALLLLNVRRDDHAVVAGTPADAGQWNAQDQADDALLRDVARLSRGEEGGAWNTLAPDARTTDPDEDKS